MAKVYARLETLSAPLTTEFGLDWATKLFGAEAVASLSVFTKGKNKGKPKQSIIWRKATTPGWCREVQMPVAVGQLTDAWIGLWPTTPRESAVSGSWCGRTETLALSRIYLFDDGRARKLAENARYSAELEAAREEYRSAGEPFGSV